MTTSLFQCNNKEEEKRIINYFTFDILFEISKFIKKIKDFLHFAQTNKSFYENLILNDNNRMIALNEIFKHNKIILNNKINYPEYLFQVKNLMLLDESELDPNLEIIKKFNNLKRLQELTVNVKNIKPEYVNNLKNCNKLYLEGSGGNLKEESLQQLINLVSLDINYCSDYKCDFLPYLTNLTELHAMEIPNLKDEHLLNLKKLKKLYIFECKNIVGNCLLELTNLKDLTIINTKVTDEYLKNLKLLKRIEFSVDNDYLNSGKFLFNNENLKYFGFNIGLHSYSAGLKHVKEFRKLLNEGLDFKEASQKMIKLILED
ncbi:hypothetical protein ABK040_003718 [Willaertia magna]